uniref:NADP-dependent oxidoreductase domain-containing protein n=1 Tax=Opuntia streptacantha TaxID=393608 RepID=A0A7C8ZLL1_OPUST
MHPMWRQNKLRKFCGEHKIHVSAYMPLGGPGNLWGSTAIVKDPIIQSIAQKHKATPAQVIHSKYSLFQLCHYDHINFTNHCKYRFTGTKNSELDDVFDV